MANIFSEEDGNAIFFYFYYVSRKVDEYNGEILHIFDSKIEKPPEKFHKGKIYLRRPTWAIMNDISRESGIVESLTGKTKIDPYKYRDSKLKRLLLRIEDHNGDVFYVDDEFVNSMNPVLASFVLNKIDQILECKNNEDRLSREEARELAFDIFNYLKKKEDRNNGKNIPLPPMPSIMLITHLCERFHITPDEARKISSRDLEMMSIVEEQSDVVNNPQKYGYGDPDRHIKLRR